MAGPRRVLLIGMMGAGKSTTGQLLAARLGWPYLDSDAEVLRLTGRTIPEIWKADGEAAFRAEERRALSLATTSDGPVVIGVAGGAVLDPDNRARVRSAGLVVWLRAAVTTLVDRVGEGTGRPLLDGGPAEAIRHLSAARAPVYAELADATIDVDGLAPSQVVDRILAALHDRWPGEASHA